MTISDLDRYLASCGINHQGYKRTKNARFCPECDSRIMDDLLCGPAGIDCPECGSRIHISTSGVRSISRQRALGDVEVQTAVTHLIPADDLELTIPDPGKMLCAAGCGTEIGFRDSYFVEYFTGTFGSRNTTGIKFNRTVPDQKPNVIKTYGGKLYPIFDRGRACHECTFNKPELQITVLPDPDTTYKDHGKNVRVGSGSNRISRRPDPTLVSDEIVHPETETSIYREEVIGFYAGPVTSEIRWQKIDQKSTRSDQEIQLESRPVRRPKTPDHLVLKQRTGLVIQRETVTQIIRIEPADNE